MANTFPTTLADINVPWEELYGQDSGSILQESISMQSGSATKTFKVGWSDRWAFVESCLARVETIGGAGGSITFYSPLQYPDFKGMYAQQIQMAGYGNFIGGYPQYSQIVYEFAIITVTFGTVTWNFDSSEDPNGTTPNLYCSIATEFGAQQLELPASAYKYVTSGNQVTKPIPLLVPTMNLSITQNYCPFIPLATIFGCVGKVNSQSFYNINPGYCLYLGASSQTDLSVSSATISSYQQYSKTQTLTHKFSARAVPWNSLMTPNGTGFDMVVDTNGNGPYGLADLNSLLFYGSGATPTF